MTTRSILKRFAPGTKAAAGTMRGCLAAALILATLQSPAAPLTAVAHVRLAADATGDTPDTRVRLKADTTHESAVAQDGSAPPAALTPLDYLEIRQLVARYAYAVDTGADAGAVYASLFTKDGAFVDRTGREITGPKALAELARRNARGPQSAFHFIVNHVIEPSPRGATGRQYLLQLRIGETGRPNDVFGGGTYDDEYEKTPEGWRFRRRRYVPSEGTASGR